MTIAEAAQALRARRISSLELTQQCLDQIAKLNPVLNAFITVTGDSALARAEELDRELAQGVDRGPLHGIPIAHKDLMWTKGVRTTSGSKIFADFVPDHDAAVVAKLADAGAVMVGKAGLHELAYGITSDNPHFGTIRNPRKPEHSPGGSSGGSGVAVATGMAFMATGTDTGGSIRVPASFCGVAGLKPTYGLINRSGVQPLGLSLDHVGPLARTVGDIRLSLNVMSDPASRKPGPAALREIRVGLPENFYFDALMPEVKAAVRDAAGRAEKLGARVIPVRVPDIEALNTTGLVILLSEAAALHQSHLHRRGDFGADVLALLDQGSLVPAADYVNAQRQRKVLLAEFHKLFQGIDCLFTPATPITAPRIGQTEITLDGAKYDTRMLTTRFARGINVLGFPALSIPCGESPDGLPIGLQMIARPWEENLLLALGEDLFDITRQTT
ncbi:MAG TPA: amidase [Bryobacteraceae bacterium]|nr:amidase [Bryobacteraceae bacterium]